MSLRFLCDQCVPTEISDYLRQRGHEVSRLNQVLPIRSPDAAVISKAQELKAILLSLNGDFSDIVAYPPSKYLGIFAVQLHNHPEIIPILMERLNSFLVRNPSNDFYHGKLFVIEAHRIRIRH